MFVYLLLIVNLIASAQPYNSTFSLIYGFSRCCKVGSGLIKENNGFICEISEQLSWYKRQGVHNEENECVEVFETTANLFKIVEVNNSNIKLSMESNKIIPKCCPTGYQYKPNKHSCQKITSNPVFNATFFRVGLRNCKIIFDYKFSSEADFKIIKNNIFIPQSNKTYRDKNYCSDKTIDGRFVVRGCENFKLCKKVRCIHKCCPDGQSFVNGSNCKDTYVYGLDLRSLSKNLDNVYDEFAIVHNFTRRLYKTRSENFHLDAMGTFHSWDIKTGYQASGPEKESYCIEFATKNGIVFNYTFFRNFVEIQSIDIKFIFNRWAMSLSALFLLATMLCYSFTKERRKVFGRTLLSFCASLLVLDVILVYSTFNINLNAANTISLCRTIGFCVLYFGFSCFVWLQVMCFDIYRKFGSTNKKLSTAEEKKWKTLKRFIFYSIYGWGLPFIMTAVPALFYYLDVLPQPIRVDIGITRCLIERGGGNYADLLFRTLPISIIQVVNIVFFIRTVKYCLQVKKDIQKMNQSIDQKKKENRFRAKKERFVLITKLSIIMGIFYLFEVVSSLYDFHENIIARHIEILWDLINCSQGIFIFIIFVCKKKYFKKCGSNMGLAKIRRFSMTTTNSTRTTNLSSVRKKSQETIRKISKEELRAHCQLNKI